MNGVIYQNIYLRIINEGKILESKARHKPRFWPLISHRIRLLWALRVPRSAPWF